MFHLVECRFKMASALAFTALYLFHCDECRIEIAHILALTVFICVSNMINVDSLCTCFHSANICFSVKNIGWRLPLYLLSQC